MAETPPQPVLTNGYKNQMLIKKETIRNYVGKDWRVYSDFFPKLDKKVKQLIEESMERAQAHGQKSLMACHL